MMKLTKFLLLMTIILSGCDGEKPEIHTEPYDNAIIRRTPTKPNSSYYSIATIKHDDHLFVLWDGSQKGGYGSMTSLGFDK